MRIDLTGDYDTTVYDVASDAMTLEGYLDAKPVEPESPPILGLSQVQPISPIEGSPNADALDDSNVLGSLGDAGSWSGWLAVHKAAAGVALTEAETSFFAAVSGGRKAPVAPVKELVVISGRRSGKSRQSGAICVYEACLVGHRLVPGEVGYVLCLSATVAQAKQIFNYALGFLEASPLLRSMILPKDGVTAGEIRLNNGVIIATHPNSYRSVRGRTILCAIFDETAFWEDEESQNPAGEVARAVRPSLLESRGRLVMISSPYRKAGLLYERWKEFFGKDDARVLVVQAPSLLFNPTLDEVEIEKATRADPDAALAEWQGEFRDDISSFLDDALIESAVDKFRPLEFPPGRNVRYFAAVDASGGRSDSYTIAIGHKFGDRIIVDLVRGVKPPFNPSTVTAEFAFLCREYGISRVTGDNYSAEWCANSWQSQGLGYVVSDMTASALYIEMISLFTQGRISLPEHHVLIRELRNLERRTSRSGRDMIGHPAGQHDDHANALAGLCRLVTGGKAPGGCVTKLVNATENEQRWFAGQRRAPVAW